MRLIWLPASRSAKNARASVRSAAAGFSPSADITPTTPRQASDNGVFSTNKVRQIRFACSFLLSAQNCVGVMFDDRNSSATR